MANIQRYCVNWKDSGRLIVEVDHDVLTENELHQINEFWVSADERLEECDNDILHVVLGLLAEVCFRHCFDGRFSASMLIDAFESGVEGWPRMDGSAGIKIIGCDEPDFFISDMVITKWEDEDNAH